MDKRRRIVVVVACFLCILLLGIVARSGALGQVRAVDALSLFAAGVLAGAAGAQLLSRRRG